jgi:pimeloyl-ACP methyl ester carboxylesterase
MRHVATDVLDIAYEEGGPAAEAPVVLLLHGWPDDIRGWRGVAPRLHASGFRTIAREAPDAVAAALTSHLGEAFGG